MCLGMGSYTSIYTSVQEGSVVMPTKIFKHMLPPINQFYFYSGGKDTIFVKQKPVKKSIHKICILYSDGEIQIMSHLIRRVNIKNGMKSKYIE